MKFGLFRRARGAMLTLNPKPMIPYQRRAPRWMHVLCLVPTVGLTAVLTDAVFLPGELLFPAETKEQIDPVGRLILGLLSLVGAFLAGVFLYRVVKSPVWFRMDERGFEYSPGGISTGFIPWTDVERIDDVPVLQGGAGGARTVRALGVHLKDPASYIARQPHALHVLFEQRRYHSGTPLVIAAGDFGSERERVVTTMRDCVARARS